MYCEKCGSKMKKGSEICYNCGNVRKSNINKYLINEENLPEMYKPITMWGYFGYQVLFAIPILGWIILIVFALGELLILIFVTLQGLIFVYGLF